MTKELYGLVGHPLEHSFSHSFFNGKFAREGRNAEYLNYDMDSVAGLRRLIADTPQLRGLNVTAPYKKDVIALMDTITEGAAKVQAVNVIAIDRSNGKLTLTGHNTDVIGFQQAAAPLVEGHVKNALVLGTGGAGRAVTAALQNLGVKVTHVSRNPGDQPDTIAYSQIDRQVAESNRLIVNATPLGTYPNVQAAPPIDYNLLTPQHICMDVVYNPAVTWFMRLCAQRGCTVKNGLEMLHRQAMAAWHIWNG